MDTQGIMRRVVVIGKPDRPFVMGAIESFDGKACVEKEHEALVRSVVSEAGIYQTAQKVLTVKTILTDNQLKYFDDIEYFIDIGSI